MADPSPEPQPPEMQEPEDERAGRVQPWVRDLAWYLDEAVAVPGTNRRVGIDGMIGLVPGVGEAAGFTASVTVVVAAIWGGVRGPTIARMVLNVSVEAVVGLVPVIGDLFDFAWKANSRNVALIAADLADAEATRRSSVRALAISAVVVAVLFGIALAGLIAGILTLIWLLRRIL